MNSPRGSPPIPTVAFSQRDFVKISLVSSATGLSRQGCPRCTMRQAGRPRVPGLAAAVQALAAATLRHVSVVFVRRKSPSFCSALPLPTDLRAKFDAWARDGVWRLLDAWRLPVLSGPLSWRALLCRLILKSFSVNKRALTYTQNLQRYVCGEE